MSCCGEGAVGNLGGWYKTRCGCVGKDASRSRNLSGSSTLVDSSAQESSSCIASPPLASPLVTPWRSLPTGEGWGLRGLKRLLLSAPTPRPGWAVQGTWGDNPPSRLCYHSQSFLPGQAPPAGAGGRSNWTASHPGQGKLMLHPDHPRRRQSSA